LANNTWIADVAVDSVALLPGTPDAISWTLSADGTYSAGSAYKSQFQGSTSCSFKQIVWKAWAPPKCRFFTCLAVQNWLWTSDRLAIRGWPY
jgi:hypothetical protein